MLKTLAVSALAAMLLASSGLTLANASSDGVLTIATPGEPPTLDAMQTPTDLVLTIDQHIFETLFTYDAQSKVVPLLTTALPVVSEDGLTYHLTLRDGIKFHDGTTMDSGDVVASLERWMRINAKGKQVAEYVDKISEDGKLGVFIKLKSLYSPLIATLTSAAIIMPKNKIADTLSEYVGTGPYALKERKPDQYIRLVRFDGYKSPEGEPSNYAGKREAIASELVFVPVPDANTRVEGLIAGQFDYADVLPVSAYDRIKSSANAEPVILKDAGWVSVNMNMREGILKNQKMRQAVQAALDESAMMMGGLSDENFYSVDGSFFPKGSLWYSEKGIVHYGEADPETAMKLMKEAGYDGTPIRILTNRQYEFQYKIAEVAKAYLEAAGFKVDLMVMDWATLSTRRTDPKLWDIFITQSNFPVDPTIINTISDTYPGWYVSDKKAAAVSKYLVAKNESDKLAAWEGIQSIIYEEAPLVKVGNYNQLAGVAKGVKGYTPTFWPHFWNVTPRK